MRKIMCILLVAVLTLGTISPVLAQEDTMLAALRLKWYDSLTGGDYDETDPDIRGKVESAVGSAEGYWNSMTKNFTSETKRLWSDMTLEYTSTGEGLHNTVDRLRMMAQGYGYRHNNTAMKNDILGALQYLNTYVYHDGIKYERKGDLNWYYWEIGVPKNLVDIMVILYDDMDAGLRDGLISAIRHFTANDPGKGGFGKGTSTGANLTWKCMVYAVGGAVAGDAAMVRLAAERITPVFEYADLAGNADGFYTDGSYIQHNVLPYTGGYGVSTIADSMKMVWYLDGTAFALDSQYKKVLLDWSVNAFLPVIYNGNLMDMVRGREITRYNARDKAKAAGVLGTLFQIADIADGGERETLLSAIKRNVTTSEDRKKSFLNNLPISEIGPAKALLNGPVQPAGDRESAKVFGGMDRVVYTGDGFAFGISMYSKRISAYEAITDDNPQGWYTGFGMTYLYNSNVNHYSDSYWPTVDPTAHAGTTVSDVFRANSYKGANDGYQNTQNWAGGATLNGRYASAGLILEDFKNKTEEQTLAAKKSWFLFDNKIVALGTGIQSPHPDRRIKTTVDNRMISGSPAVTADGQRLSLSDTSIPVKRYFHISDSLAQTGYYFPAGGNITVKQDQRSGSWKNLSNKPYNPATQYTSTYYTITQDHGVQPDNGCYAYIVMPEATSADMKAYSQNETVEILENSGFASGVKCENLGLEAVNFWRKYPHQTGSISVSGPASIMAQKTEDRLAVSVADPTQQRQSVEVTIDQAVSGVIQSNQRITVVETAPKLKLVIDTAGARGASAEALFELAAEAS